HRRYPQTRQFHRLQPPPFLTIPAGPRLPVGRHTDMVNPALRRTDLRLARMLCHFLAFDKPPRTPISGGRALTAATALASDPIGATVRWREARRKQARLLYKIRAESTLYICTFFFYGSG